ncbi:SlyX family protein [Marinobacterium sp. AK62]|uniref:Protein SlyX homolog n=1 Tax=Marinobacterium alkalitolerans TaxID=1542925 RepID=A0ABS3Z9P2_9GAMM|nr:SlyX family protein [Marinobacterium alkalitolerans]MBP0048425.1 SlyX family protein [Marinobacterium alkalitolerans]
MSNPENLAELESRIAFQEDAIDKLSEVVARQEMDIERLTRMVKILHTQMKDMGSADAAPEADAPPPHY